MNIGTSRTRWIAHSALYLALAVVVPMAFHYVGNALGYGIAGRVFLPMHIPVLLAGFLVGPAAGVVVGLLAPGLSCLLTQMPPVHYVAQMSLELPIYGLVAGITYQRLRMNIYVSLVLAMLIGRMFFGLGLLLLGLFMDLPYGAGTWFTWANWFGPAGIVMTGFPGLLLQIILIPILVAAVKRKKQWDNNM